MQRQTINWSQNVNTDLIVLKDTLIFAPFVIRRRNHAERYCMFVHADRWPGSMR